MLCDKCNDEICEAMCLIADDGNICRDCFCREFEENLKKVPGMNKILNMMGGKVPGVPTDTGVLSLMTWNKLKSKNRRELKKNGKTS